MFDIANGVDGSSISYTINYTVNSHSDVRILYNTEVSVISVMESCVNGTCEYDDQISPSISPLSSDNITVTVSGIKMMKINWLTKTSHDHSCLHWCGHAGVAEG